jgi:undecaprenyl diphosphate synthase
VGVVGACGRAFCATVEAAALGGVKTLTVYAIVSQGNPAAVAALMPLSRLLRICVSLPDNGRAELAIRVSAIGRPLGCGSDEFRDLERLEGATAQRTGMHLRMVFNYSAHDAVVHAARCARTGATEGFEDFRRRIQELDPTALAAGAVDLLIRTGRGLRLGDFMLWETAYAEQLFVGRLWPDFSGSELGYALHEYFVRRNSAAALMSCDAGNRRRRCASTL